MANFLAFLWAIPDLIKLAREIFEWVKKLTGDNPRKFMVDLHDAVQEIRLQKPGEKDPKKLQELIRRL